MFHQSGLAGLAGRPVSASCRLQPSLGRTGKQKWPRNATICVWGSGSGDAGASRVIGARCRASRCASSSRGARAMVGMRARKTFRGAARIAGGRAARSARIWQRGKAGQGREDNHNHKVRTHVTPRTTRQAKPCGTRLPSRRFGSTRHRDCCMWQH